jgi:imidazoleglycerol phosphate synthase glutamine amidotransferase subunit HisH
VSWPVIALLDYDSGNIRSVEKALRKAGAEVVRTRTPEALADALRRIADSVAQFEVTSSAIISGATRDDDGKAVGHFHIM